MSGSPEKPDISGQKPDIWPPARVRNAPGFSRSSRYSEFPVQPHLNPRPCGMKATVGEPATESTAPKKPDIWPPARVRNAPGFSRSSRYSEFPVQPLLNPRPCGMKERLHREF